MARNGSGFFPKLIIVVLVVLAVWNAWQIHTLKAEVVSLKKARSAGRLALQKKAVNGSESLLDKSKDHFDLAGKYLLKGDTERARAELQKTLLLLEKEGHNTAEPAKGSVEKLHRSVQDFIKRLDQTKKQKVSGPTDDLLSKFNRMRKAWNKDEKSTGEQ